MSAEKRKRDTDTDWLELRATQIKRNAATSLHFYNHNKYLTAEKKESTSRERK